MVCVVAIGACMFVGSEVTNTLDSTNSINSAAIFNSLGIVITLGVFCCGEVNKKVSFKAFSPEIASCSGNTIALV